MAQRQHNGFHDAVSSAGIMSWQSHIRCCGLLCLFLGGAIVVQIAKKSKARKGLPKSRDGFVASLYKRESLVVGGFSGSVWGSLSEIKPKCTVLHPLL